MASETDENITGVLSVLGNETRRRILQLLADEPRYFIQLARDLDVSQQALLKHLDMLINMGFINSFRTRSVLAGPDRKYYRLNRSLLLTVGMAGDVFRIRFHDLEKPNEESTEPNKSNDSLEQVDETDDISKILSDSKELIKRLDKDLTELDERRVKLLRMRQDVTSKVHNMIRRSFEQDLERRILYSILNSRGPTNVESLSDELDTREKEIRLSVEYLKSRLSLSFLD